MTLQVILKLGGMFKAPKISFEWVTMRDIVNDFRISKVP